MATNERVNFELELCGAIERNKNLLPPDAFNCDQFNGLLRSIGGLSMPPLWHVSILKIAAVIADQQAKRAEEELLRQTQNESAAPSSGPHTERQRTPADQQKYDNDTSDHTMRRMGR